MKPIFKLRNSTLLAIRSDLERHHPFAFERVGCLFTRPAIGSRNRSIILGTRYKPLPDHHYIRDNSVGARISSAAIQALMQEILDSREGAFLVHVHDHLGLPSLSTTDRRDMLPLVFSLRNVAPLIPHGALLLSKDCAAGWALLPDQQHLTPISKLTVVGFPTSLIFDIA